jgi:hypothetical protein
VRADVDAFLERQREQRARSIEFSIGLVVYNVASYPWTNYSTLSSLTTFAALGEWAWVGRVYEPRVGEAHRGHP